MTVPEKPDGACPVDARLLADLRELPTANLGRLAQPLLEAVQSGDTSASTRHALDLIGVALSERKAAA